MTLSQSGKSRMRWVIRREKQPRKEEREELPRALFSLFAPKPYPNPSGKDRADPLAMHKVSVPFFVEAKGQNALYM